MLAVWVIGAVITAVVHLLQAWPHVKSWTWFTASGTTAPTAGRRFKRRHPTCARKMQLTG